MEFFLQFYVSFRYTLLIRDQLKKTINMNTKANENNKAYEGEKSQAKP